MQVAFSDKHDTGVFIETPVKGHRITDKQREVSEMGFICVSRKSFVGGSERLAGVSVSGQGRCTHQTPFQVFASGYFFLWQALAREKVYAGGFAAFGKGRVLSPVTARQSHGSVISVKGYHLFI